MGFVIKVKCRKVKRSAHWWSKEPSQGFGFHSNIPQESSWRLEPVTMSPESQCQGSAWKRPKMARGRSQSICIGRVKHLCQKLGGPSLGPGSNAQDQGEDQTFPERSLAIPTDIKDQALPLMRIADFLSEKNSHNRTSTGKSAMYELPLPFFFYATPATILPGVFCPRTTLIHFSGAVPLKLTINQSTHNINRSKDKSYINISIHGERAFDKIPHPFIIMKKLKKIGVTWPFLNLIEVTGGKSINSQHIKWKEAKAFPLKSRIRQGHLYLLSCSIQYSNN